MEALAIEAALANLIQLLIIAFAIPTAIILMMACLSCIRAGCACIRWWHIHKMA